jgi:hypothetical protein
MMSDDRVRVATTKQINLAQLDVELGGYGLNGAEGIVQACEGSPVTEAELSAAIAAHVFVDPDAERLAVRESAMAKLAALGLSDVEVAAIVGSV